MGELLREKEKKNKKKEVGLDTLLRLAAWRTLGM